MLKSFSVKNYRNLNVDGLEFNRVNVLIGPNNSGKSNLIDAISFLSNLVLQQDSTSVSSVFLNELLKRGWNDLIDRRTTADEIEMCWDIETSREHPNLRYELKYHIPGAKVTPPEGYNITLEKLSATQALETKLRPFEYFQCHGEETGVGWFSGKTVDGKRKSKRAKINLSSQETVFNQLSTLLDNDEFRIKTYPSFKVVAEIVKKFFQGFHHYSSTEVHLEKLRELAGIQLHLGYLSKNADNFVNVIRYLNENHDNFLNMFVEQLKEILPKLRSIKIHEVEEHKSTLIMNIDGVQYSLSEMSDGTLKAIIIALLLWSPQKVELLSLDEPELNLHPAWIRVIAGWISKTNMAKQIIISTHSPDLLDGLTELFMEKKLNLYAFNLDKDQSLKLITPESVMTYIKEGWQLGDLYRIGQPEVGGWPW